MTKRRNQQESASELALGTKSLEERFVEGEELTRYERRELDLSLNAVAARYFQRFSGPATDRFTPDGHLTYTADEVDQAARADDQPAA